MRARIGWVVVVIALLALTGIVGVRAGWFAAGVAPPANGSAGHSADLLAAAADTADAAAQERATAAAEGIVAPSAPNDGKTLSTTSLDNASIPVISAATARALMQEYNQERDCLWARNGDTAKRLQMYEDSEWRWMAPERADAERQAITEATERYRASCPPAKDDATAKKQRQHDNEATLAAAERTGDLLARIRKSSTGPRRDSRQDELRALMYEIVLSGDVEAISQLGWLELSLNKPSSIYGYFPSPIDVWQLVACDLGLACGPGSRTLDLICLTSSPPFGACGYDSFEAELRDRLPLHQWQHTDQRRNQILNRIRSGQIAGMFDPPPTTHRPGGG